MMQRTLLLRVGEVSLREALPKARWLDVFIFTFNKKSGSNSSEPVRNLNAEPIAPLSRRPRFGFGGGR